MKAIIKIWGKENGAFRKKNNNKKYFKFCRFYCLFIILILKKPLHLNISISSRIVSRNILLLLHLSNYPRSLINRFRYVLIKNIKLNKDKIYFLNKLGIQSLSFGRQNFKYFYLLKSKSEKELQSMSNIVTELTSVYLANRFLFISSDSSISCFLLKLLNRLHISYGLNQWFPGGITNFSLISRYLTSINYERGKKEKTGFLNSSITEKEKNLSVLIFAFGFRFLYKKLPLLSFVANKDSAYYPVVNEIIKKRLFTFGISSTISKFTFSFMGNSNLGFLRLCFLIFFLFLIVRNKERTRFNQLTIYKPLNFFLKKKTTLIYFNFIKLINQRFNKIYKSFFNEKILLNNILKLYIIQQLMRKQNKIYKILTLKNLSNIFNSKDLLYSNCTAFFNINYFLFSYKQFFNFYTFFFNCSFPHKNVPLLFSCGIKII
jgi:hypothetical protein